MNKNIDLLGRDGYIEIIDNFLSSAYSSKINKILCLDGEWGIGKSFIIDKYIESKKNSNMFILQYNPCSSDFYDEPLVGLLYTIIKQINEYKKDENMLKAIGEEILTNCLYIFESIISSVSEKFLHFDIVKLSKKAKAKIKKWGDQNKISVEFNNNIGIEKAKQTMVETLNAISEKVNVLLIVDDLDRCLPEYSVKVLERLHHIFDNCSLIEGIVCLDTSILRNTISNTFFFNSMDEKDKNKCVELYFRKYFDHYLIINEGNFDNKLNENFKDYISIFDYHFDIVSESEVNEFINQLFNGVNIRTVVKIIEKAQLIHNALYKLEYTPDMSIMCAELLFSFISYLYPGDTNAFYKAFSDFCYPTSFINSNFNDPFNFIKEHFYNRRKIIKLKTSPVDFTIDIQDFYSFLWFALPSSAINKRTHSYTFVNKTKIDSKELDKMYSYLNVFAYQIVMLWR